MNGRKENFNLKIEELQQNLPQKLLESFNEEKAAIEFEFLCLSHDGITVNPVKCK